MLRLTQWIADYYLCDWAAVLEAVVPAGVRGQAGTRLATLLVGRSARRPSGWRELNLPAKQLEVLKVLAGGQGAADARRVGPGGPLHARRPSPPCGARA